MVGSQVHLSAECQSAAVAYSGAFLLAPHLAHAAVFSEGQYAHLALFSQGVTSQLTVWGHSFNALTIGGTGTPQCHQFPCTNIVMYLCL